MSRKTHVWTDQDGKVITESVFDNWTGRLAWLIGRAYESESEERFRAALEEEYDQTKAEMHVLEDWLIDAGAPGWVAT